LFQAAIKESRKKEYNSGLAVWKKQERFQGWRRPFPGTSLSLKRFPFLIRSKK
jgi:hypothetical protein